MPPIFSGGSSLEMTLTPYWIQPGRALANCGSRERRASPTHGWTMYQLINGYDQYRRSPEFASITRRIKFTVAFGSITPITPTLFPSHVRLPAIASHFNSTTPVQLVPQCPVYMTNPLIYCSALRALTKTPVCQYWFLIKGLKRGSKALKEILRIHVESLQCLDLELPHPALRVLMSSVDSYHVEARHCQAP